MYKFERLSNFRDLGDILAADGKRVAPGRLLRSAGLSDLTTQDIQILCEKYHVVNVVDLRTKSECLEKADVEIPGASYINLDFFPEAEQKANCSEEQLNQMQSAGQQRENLLNSYRSFITQESVRKSLYEFLRLLLCTEKGATLFHCYAGKDRTGITAAVTLSVLGVDKEAIMKDYLATNELCAETNRMIIDYLRNEGRPENVLEAVIAGLCAEQIYLEAAFETAEKMYGSFENYISEGIGLKGEEWQKLRDLYLV